jgi:hypothetical protein
MKEKIAIGYQVFTKDGGEELGAVRKVSHQGIMVYIENAGDFVIPFDAVHAVHSEKVILDEAKLEPGLLSAIAHAHDKEE